MQRVFQRVFWVGFAIYPAWFPQCCWCCCSCFLFSSSSMFSRVLLVLLFLFFGVLPVCLVVLGFVSNHLKGYCSRLYSPLPLNFRPDLSGICNTCNIIPMNSFIFDFFQFCMNPLEYIYIWRSFLLCNMTWHDPFLGWTFLQLTRISFAPLTLGPYLEAFEDWVRKPGPLHHDGCEFSEIFCRGH